MTSFKLDPDYKGVPERIADFREKHPDGRLRPVDQSRPYWLERVGDKTFVVYAAAAYRDKDDTLPGIGLAWEEFPGPTPYTANSELQNAETSAWGRAIVACLASESKYVASREDVQRGQAQVEQADPTPEQIEWKEAMDGLTEILKLISEEHRSGCVAYLRERFGSPLSYTLEHIHEAANIAAGWTGEPPTAQPDVPLEGEPF
jgi:hypothetical protein